jgi:hypothetical protein
MYLIMYLIMYLFYYFIIYLSPYSEVGDWNIENDEDSDDDNSINISSMHSQSFNFIRYLSNYVSM